MKINLKVRFKNPMLYVQLVLFVFTNDFHNLVFDFPVCIAAASVAIIPTIIQGRFKKWQGFALLTIYAVYMLLLILNETGVVAIG